MRRVAIPLFLVLVPFVSAQQGAGGYGQGGFGGGAMGGPGGVPARRMGSDFEEAQKARPDDEDNPQIWSVRSAIVTPGDRVEYKFDMKKGETLFAGVTSDAFDPGLSIVDANGKELAKNDDRMEGDQSPFLAYRFPEAGTYTLRVLAFKSAAGGKFILKSRTFEALDAKLGPSTFEMAPGPDGDARVIFRLPATKDKVYDLWRANSVKPFGSPLGFLRIVGPTGSGTSDLEPITTPDGTLVFRALTTGDFYIEYRVFRSTRVSTDYREVAVQKASTKGETTIDLNPTELKLVEFPVEPNLIVRTTLVGKNLEHRLNAPADPRRQNGNGDETYGNDASQSFFLLNRDSDDDVARIFHGKGTARIAIRSNDLKPQKATLRNAESLPEWPAGEASKGTLGIGDIRLFLIRSSKSELMKVFAKAPAFQVRLDIFRLDGTIANSLMDRATRSAGDDLYFPDADTFLVRLYCDGYGGSGEYAMKREALTPSPYRLGAPQALTLDGANFGLYSVELEAGKRYQLTLEGTETPTRVDLLDDDGQFLVSQAVQFDNVVVHYFVPTRSGRHRLWLRGAPGSRKFKFEPHKLPTAG